MVSLTPDSDSISLIEERHTRLEKGERSGNLNWGKGSQKAGTLGF